MASLDKSNTLLNYRMQIWQSNSWNTISYVSIPSTLSSNDDFFHLDELSLPDKDLVIIDEVDSDGDSFIYTKTEDNESYLKLKTHNTYSFKLFRLKAYQALRQTLHFLGNIPNTIRRSSRDIRVDQEFPEIIKEKKQHRSGKLKRSLSLSNVVRRLRNKRNNSNDIEIKLRKNEQKSKPQLQNIEYKNKEIKPVNNPKTIKKHVRFNTRFFSGKFRLRKKHFKRIKSKGKK